MKIIHTADLHLDSRMESILTKEKARQRNNELINTFVRMARYSRDNDIRYILISGDMFDKKHVSRLVANMVIATIREYSEITFFYLRGNHDDFSFIDALEDVPDNIITFDNNWKSVELSDERVVVTGAEINEETSEAFYDSLVLDSNRFNIVMLHGQENAGISKDKAQIIPLNRLQGKGIDYLALGHIHSFKYAELDGRGNYCYSGCPDGRGFDETGEKGFVVLDIDESNFAYEATFVIFASRTIFREEVDVSGANTTAEAVDIVEAYIERTDISPDSLLEIVLTGSIGIDTELDTDYIKSQFENRFFAFRVKDKTEIVIDYQSFAYDMSLKGEFVRTVNADESLSEEEKALIIKTGIDLLRGNE